MLALALFGSINAGDAVLAQSNAPTRASYPLPQPSGEGQPSPSPFHASSWTVRRITDNGRKVLVPEEAVVYFDWGIRIGESLATVYDGCVASTSNFTWTKTQVIVQAAHTSVTSNNCVNSPKEAFRRSIIGTFTHRLPTSDVPAAPLTLVDGRRKIDLVRRLDSPLAFSKWSTPESLVHPVFGSVNGRLSFGSTTFSSFDGCNTITGRYLHVGTTILAFRTRSTLVYCKALALGWAGAPSQLTLAGDELRIAKGSSVYRYSKDFGEIPVGDDPAVLAPDPNATTAFTSAAVYGSWRIESLAERRTGPGAVGTLEFRSDGSLMGETPCERLNGTWTQAATSMATTIHSLQREPKSCDDALEPDSLALGDMLANKELAVGRGVYNLTLWKAGSGATNNGIQLLKV